MEMNGDNTKEVCNENNSVFMGFDSMEGFTKNGFASIMEATRASNALPQDQSWDLYTAHPAFLGVMDKLGDTAVNLMSRILMHQQIKGNIVRRDTDEKFEMLIETNDLIMERIGSNLDEMAGLKKNPVPILVESSISGDIALKKFSSPGTGSWNKKPVSNESNMNKIRLLTAHNIQRPQATFKDKVDNSNSNPFKPTITDKPNSRKPLALEMDEDGFTHPYDFELENFQPPEMQLKKVDPVKPLELDKTPLVRIEDEAALKSLLRDLLSVDVFALDLEHHSYRTFQGITCLMQISTRKCDYVVDTLLLRDKLHILNEAFTKTNIVKVLHGADHDVLWLQRDLGLYLVNMFDTHQAAKQLEMARLSLAYLLKYYCGVDANKHFQLADWRIRPLPEELILYARQDTHYLLYIYDMMRNELIDKGNGKSNVLESVILKSTDLCKKRYIKPKLLPDSHLELYMKSKRMFDNRQLFAFRELYNWRDNLAREEDESIGYVLPNHMLLQISETLPREMQGILACCNPIPPLVRQNLNLLHQKILKARDQPLIKPILQEEIRTRGSDQKSGFINIDGPLHCPHDLSQQMEFRDDLPTLLGDLKDLKDDKCFAHNILLQNDLPILSKSIQSIKPKLSVFESPINSDEEELSADLLKLKHITFISPYERYKLVRPFVDSVEKESKSAEAENKKCPEKGSTTVNQEYTSAENQQSIDRLKEHFNTLTNNTISQEKEENEVRNLGFVVEDNSKQCSSYNVDDIDAEGQVLPLRMQRKRKREPSVEGTSTMNTGNSIETNEEKSNNEKYSNSQKNSFKRGKNKNKNSKNKNNPTNTDSEYRAFDYGTVDFRKFQGGSQQAPKQDQFNSKFKAKGKNNKFNGYRNNKSYTYAGNKGGRNK